MISNDLCDIFFALKHHHEKNLALHIKIASISLISKKLCNNSFMTLLTAVVKVFKEDTINNVISLNVHENPSCCCTLFVFKNGTLTPWLTLKFSSIKNSGLGVFSSQKFKKTEFINCYLGEVDENPSDEMYTFKKINGKPVNSASALLEDYWFCHRIQHGSGNQVNVSITSGYVIKAKKGIEIGEELFMDYNRSLFCGNVKLKLIFMINVSRSLRSAIFVEVYA